MRIKIFKVAAIFGFIFLTVYLFYVQVIRAGYYLKLSQTNAIRIIPEEGARGRILDRNNEVIVDNYLSYDVFVLSRDFRNKDIAFHRLSQILGVPAEEIKKRLARGYVAPFVPICIAENIDRKPAMKIEIERSEFPEVIVDSIPKRHYPNSRLASHEIGYLGEIDYWRLVKLQDYGYRRKDIVGYGGVEERYDYYLRPAVGGLQVEVDYLGKFSRTLGYRYPDNGKDVRLTIDLNIQKIAENNLSSSNGAVVIMNPLTGEILAMASFPDFDPGLFYEKSPSSLQGVFTASDAPLLSRAISGAYPPGSVFKLVTAMAALSTGKINTGTAFYCPGSLRVGRREFACWDTHGSQNLYQAIVHSCDVFFYHTGILAGPQAIYDYALKLGLGRPTGIDLPSEKAGFIPSPFWKKTKRNQRWYDGDTANFSIGQGDVLTTPLQITRMMAVFANGGYLVTPYIVKSIGGRPLSRRKIVDTGLNKEFIRIISRGLKGVIDDPGGTAQILDMSGLSVAGKTGTAEAPPSQPHSWFVGFFPYESPKYVICVFLEHGGSSFYACKLAKGIIEEIMKENLL